MEKYGQRVAAARGHVGWSQSKLARELGISQPSLSELEAGDSRGSKHSYKIAQKTGVRMDWLENNSGHMVGAAEESSRKFDAPPPDKGVTTFDLTKQEINTQAMPRDVPILGGASCGEDGLFELNGQVLDYARRPPRLQNVKDAYAVFIAGESMSPWREDGDFVYVQPHHPVKLGDYVVVQLVDGKNDGPPKAYIKKLVRRTEKDLRLSQFKPPGEITLPMKQVKSIHRIIDWKELMGI